jgi:hypothetical protein
MGAHFYCITIGGLLWRKTVWPAEPIEREKGRGRVGSWKSQFANIGRIIRQVGRRCGPVVRPARYRWTIYYTDYGAGIHGGSCNPISEAGHILFLYPIHTLGHFSHVIIFFLLLLYILGDNYLVSPFWF